MNYAGNLLFQTSFKNKYLVDYIFEKAHVKEVFSKVATWIVLISEGLKYYILNVKVWTFLLVILKEQILKQATMEDLTFLAVRYRV